MKQRAQQGFTLIELMIVVAIIGILAAVAIPQYKDYTAKAKASSFTSSVNALKTAVAMCAQTTGALAGCNSNSNDIPQFVATKETASVDVADGIITAKFGTNVAAGVDGKAIVYTPTFKAGETNMNWTVDASAITDNAAVKDYLEKNNPVAAAPAP